MSNSRGKLEPCSTSQVCILFVLASLFIDNTIARTRSSAAGGVRPYLLRSFLVQRLFLHDTLISPFQFASVALIGRSADMQRCPKTCLPLTSFFFRSRCCSVLEVVRCTPPFFKTDGLRGETGGKGDKFLTLINIVFFAHLQKRGGLTVVHKWHWVEGVAVTPSKFRDSVSCDHVQRGIQSGGTYV